MRSLWILLFCVVVDSQRFPRQKTENIIALPEIEVVKTIVEPPTHFTGKFHSEYNVYRNSGRKLSLDEEEAYLSWEVAWPQTGKRVEKVVSLHESRVTVKENQTENPFKNNLFPKHVHREKRNIYHHDDRRGVSSIISSRMFPYVAVVKVSTGCTGTLVSPKHVLTAAHCIHDQSDYVEGFKELKVGFIQPRLQLPRRGRYRYRLRSRFLKRYRYRNILPVKWMKVVNSYIPQGWTIGMPDIASLFDYSLLELESEHDKDFFKLGISENSRNGQGKPIYFTSFEDDKPLYSLWYRACQIMDTDPHVLYHYCDALPGSSGAGVYAWETDIDTNVEQRVLIGVFSGNRWKLYEDGGRKITVNYNAAIRMTSAKYTQVCKWMGKHAVKTCNRKYYVT